MNEDNIKMLNEVFGDVSLTEAENRSLQLLSGWEPDMAKNILSAFKRAERIAPLDKCGEGCSWILLFS